MNIFLKVVGGEANTVVMVRFAQWIGLDNAAFEDGGKMGSWTIATQDLETCTGTPL